MASKLARRLFLAHLELSYRLGRKVTLAEFGDLVARQMGRDAAFSAAAVSRWEAGTQVPSADVIEAIAGVTHTDPGWISHGDRSAAPAPRSMQVDEYAGAEVDLAPSRKEHSQVVEPDRLKPKRRRT